MKTTKRYLGEMKNMYGLPSDELYTMQRGVKNKGDLRYDITIIPPFIINGQNNKTKGHIHKSGHKEEYIVLSGEAIFLLQNKDEAYYVKAVKGDRVIIPGTHYHITINPGLETLKLSNWVSVDCVSEYKYIERMNGMCYYYFNGKWVKNPKYKICPKLKKL